MESQIAAQHNRYAPYWAAALLLFGITGLSTTWMDGPSWWSGYVLDMTGPAWNYILFRGLFTAWADNRWVRFFTPTRTLVCFVGFAFGVEAAQYAGLYDATFDPLDLVAYVSLLVPLYWIDRRLIRDATRRSS